MKLKQTTLFFTMILAILFLGMQVNAESVVERTFSAKKNVTIATVSGNCKIEAGGSKITVKVKHNYSKDRFEVIFKEKGDTLVMKEDFKNKTWDNSMKNRFSKWVVTLPANTSVSFSTASGDLKVEGVKKGLKAKTASGDIKAENIGGDMNLKTASGDIKLEQAKGDLNVKTASGNIKIEGVTGAVNAKSASGDIKAKSVVFTGKSKLHSVSGEVKAGLAKSSDYDLDFSTVSGDIEVDYNGNKVKGYFKFKGQKDGISSDIPFDQDHSSKYGPFAKKSFKKGGDSPVVTFKTVSGEIEFKK